MRLMTVAGLELAVVELAPASVAFAVEPAPAASAPCGCLEAVRRGKQMQ